MEPAATAIALLRSWLPIYRIWAATPRSTVQISSSADGRLVASRLAYRLAGRWVARPLLSVIEVPASIEIYISGTSAKSRRQNLNRAQKLGLTHAPLPAGPRANGSTRVATTIGISLLTGSTQRSQPREPCR